MYIFLKNRYINTDTISSFTINYYLGKYDVIMTEVGSSVKTIIGSCASKKEAQDMIYRIIGTIHEAKIYTGPTDIYFFDKD